MLPWDVPSIILSQPQHPGGFETQTQRHSPAATGTPKGKKAKELAIKWWKRIASKMSCSFRLPG